MEPLSGPLAGALERQREGLNSAFAEARRVHRRLDPEALGALVGEVLDPITRAVHAVAPERVDAVVGALFRAALELLGRQLLGPGARLGAVERVWRELLPGLPRALAEDPARVIACLSNAALNLHHEQGFSLGQWLRTLREGAALCPRADDVLELGLVLPWRLGLAHLRWSALERLRRLPEPAARWVLGRPPEDPTPVEVLMAGMEDPWHLPGAKGPVGLYLSHRVGDFQGLGGVFTSPPRVVARGGHLYAVDGGAVWVLVADRFGATLRRFGAELPQAPEGDDRLGGVQPDGTARLGTTTRRFPELAQARSWACDGQILAVTLPHSYRVSVLGVYAVPG